MDEEGEVGGDGSSRKEDPVAGGVREVLRTVFGKRARLDYCLFGFRMWGGSYRFAGGRKGLVCGGGVSWGVRRGWKQTLERWCRRKGPLHAVGRPSVSSLLRGIACSGVLWYVVCSEDPEYNQVNQLGCPNGLA